MNTKELDKIGKEYIKIVTSPQFTAAPKSKTEAMIDWLIISVAIESVIGVKDE
jgi:hypothetical protein